MPFKSKAQERFMFAKHPEIAKEFAAHTDQAKLPEKLHPFHRLTQYFENGGKVEHSPSNQNESSLLVDDALSKGQITHRGPHTIETVDEKGRVHDFDPRLVDAELLAQVPVTQGPEPLHYEKGGRVGGRPTKHDSVPAMLKPGEEVVPEDIAEKARHGKFQSLHEYFRKYQR